MNADTFMHILGVLLITGLAGYYGLRYLKGRLDVGPARIYHPLNVAPYFRGAWEIFPRFRTIGWLLTGAVFIPLILSVLFNYHRLDTGISDGLAENTTASQYFMELLSNLPRTIFYSQNVLTKSLKISGALPFVILLAYIVFQLVSKMEGETRDHSARISGYIIIGTVVQILVQNLPAVLLEGGHFYPEIQNIFAKSAIGLLGIVSYVFLLLGATVAEGMFLRITFETLKGNTARAVDAFEHSIRYFGPLFIFNLFYFGLPTILNLLLTIFWTAAAFLPSDFSLQINPAIYMSGVTWLFRILFFLVPFIIVKDGLDLKSALKKNISIVTRAPLDYFALMFTVSISVVIVSLVFVTVTTLLIQPYSHSFILMQVTEFLFGVYYIWFSLFAACVFAVFSRQRFLNQPD